MTSRRTTPQGALKGYRSGSRPPQSRDRRGSSDQYENRQNDNFIRRQNGHWLGARDDNRFKPFNRKYDRRNNHGSRNNYDSRNNFSNQRDSRQYQERDRVYSPRNKNIANQIYFDRKQPRQFSPANRYSSSDFSFFPLFHFSTFPFPLFHFSTFPL